MGGIGGLIGGMMQADAATEAADIQAKAMDRAGERALTGYKYLTSGEGAPYAQSYMNTGVNALASQSGVQNQMLGLLGLNQLGNVGAQTPTTAPFQAAAAAPGGAGGTGTVATGTFTPNKRQTNFLSTGSA